MSEIIVVRPHRPGPITLVGGQRSTPVVTVPTSEINVTVPTGLPGPPGPPGPPGEDAKWVSMTQAQYDALPDKDPSTLYVIVP